MRNGSLDDLYERPSKRRHLPAWRCLRGRQAAAMPALPAMLIRLDSENLQEHLALIRAVELGQYHALPLAQYQCAPVDRY